MHRCYACVRCYLTDYKNRQVCMGESMDKLFHNLITDGKNENLYESISLSSCV